MKFLSKLALAVLLIAPSFAQAASSDLAAQFSNDFYKYYEAGKCGANILNLVTRANAAGIDMSRAHVVTIRNIGNSVLGLVNAEYAREEGRRYDGPSPDGLAREPGETNWGFHAILEQDGLIYDFDFGNQPKVTPVKAYFQKMFFEEYPRGSFKSSPAERMKDYEISVFPAQDYVDYTEARVKKTQLGQYLSQF